MTKPAFTNCLWLIVFLVLLCIREAEGAAFPFGLFGGRNSSPKDFSSESSSSWLTVDPSKILSTLTNRGGLFIPQTLDNDVKIMKRALHCEKSQLDLLSRNMLLRNFTIGLSGQPPLLRVGKVWVHWNSYTDPLLTIEVGDVDVSMEFTNLMLTKTNWNDITAIGFPPEFTTTASTTPTSSSSTDDYSWLRFDAVAITGVVNVRVTSAPLQRDLGVLRYDLRALKPILQEIARQSDEHARLGGRRGVPLPELAHVFQRYILQSARSYVLEHFQEIAASHPQEAIRTGIDKVLDKASNAVVDYAMEASGKKAQILTDQWRQSRWGSKLERFVVNADAALNNWLNEDDTNKKSDETTKPEGKHKESDP